MMKERCSVHKCYLAVIIFILLVPTIIAPVMLSAWRNVVGVCWKTGQKISERDLYKLAVNLSLKEKTWIVPLENNEGITGVILSAPHYNSVDDFFLKHPKCCSFYVANESLQRPSVTDRLFGMTYYYVKVSLDVSLTEGNVKVKHTREYIFDTCGHLAD